MSGAASLDQSAGLARASGVGGWVRGLLGLRDAGPAAHPDKPAPQPPSPSPAASPQTGEWAAMDRVKAFLQASRLDPRPAHYDLAWRYLIGEDRALVAGIDAAIAVEGRLTPDKAALLASNFGEGIPTVVIEGLLGDASDYVDTVAGIVGQSRDDAQAYGDAIEQRIEHFQGVGAQGSLLQQFVDLTRSLIGRSRDAEDRLRDMGGQLVELRESLDEASKAADTDPLTGLPNRRAFERRLARAVADAQVDRSPVAVAFCDIDHFKAINDTHGHDVGDRILRFVADLLGAKADEDISVARFGGEEFVMLFEHVPFETAIEMVDTVRLDLGGRRLVARDTGAPLGMVTFSAGIAPRDGEEDGITLLRAADKALYRAKELGRDRVVSARDVVD